MTRRTGTGLMEASGLGLIIGDEASLTIGKIRSIILVSTFMRQECGMTSIISSIHKDQSASMTHLKVGNSKIIRFVLPYRLQVYFLFLFVQYLAKLTNIFSQHSN